jgi:hypothetical protein
VLSLLLIYGSEGMNALFPLGRKRISKSSSGKDSARFIPQPRKPQ